MRKIIASLDLGSSSVKLLVGEMQKEKLNILACVESVSSGIKKGYIINPDSAKRTLKDVFNKAENMLGIPVRKVLVTVPSDGLECFMTSGSITIKNENNVIGHDDIIKAMQASVYKKIDDNKELVSLLPTKFILNDEENVTSPVNMIANKITVSDVAVTVPKKNTENIISILEELGIKVVDICVESLADYYCFKDEYNKTKVGAIVNIGYSKTTVSIFNRGVLTASEVIDIGSSNVDNDLAYVFKTSKKEAKYLKEKLAVADIHLARPSEALIVKDINDENIKINQYDVSAVVISRLEELFEMVKKQINLLTKKEISYIIISGGLSELKHLDNMIQELFSNKGIIGSVSQIGARSNKYSVAIGMIKYYSSRLKLRGIDFSIFTIEEQEDFGGLQKRYNISDGSLLGKVFSYFFDN